MLLGIQRQQEAVKAGAPALPVAVPAPTQHVQPQGTVPVLVTPESALVLHQQLINFFSAAPNQVAGEQAVS
eukprot:10184996-Karenia_brevis.AAC.1